MTTQALNSKNPPNNQRSITQFHARLTKAIFNGQRKTLYLSDSFPKLHLFLPKEMRINGDLSEKELENITFELSRLASIYGTDTVYGNDSLDRIQNLYRFLVGKLSDNQLPPITAEPLTARKKLAAIFSDRKFQVALAICTLISGITGGFFALATLFFVVCVTCLLLSGYVGANVAAAAFEHANWERAQELRQIALQFRAPAEPVRTQARVQNPAHQPLQPTPVALSEPSSPMSIARSDSLISIDSPASPGGECSAENSPRTPLSNNSVSMNPASPPSPDSEISE